MKKVLCILMAALLLLFAACDKNTVLPEQMQNPVQLFYCRTEIDYGTEDGVIAAQTVDFGETRPTLSALLDRYLLGPTQEGLQSPFPKQLQVLSARQEKNKVMVQLDRTYDELSGINATVADACLAKTLLLFTGAEKVELLICNAKGDTLRSRIVADSDILLLDDSSDTSSSTITLFFADENGRFLIPERRTVPYMPESEQPAYLIEQLLEGPGTNGLKKTLPDGTLLLDINIDNGVCAVDFSADFLLNRPKTPDEERTAILSVCNTLTELDSIDQVQFYVEGSRQDVYSFLSIAGQFVSDKTVIGPAREDLSETAATVYFPVSGTGLLYPLPVRLKVGSASAPETVLALLSAYEPKNGLDNPLYGLPLPESVQVRSRNCVICYPEGTVFGADAQTELAAARMLAASVTALSGINSISIRIGTQPFAFSYADLPETIVPQAEWYCN